MSMTLNIAAARMSREVPEAEASLDQAMISISALMTTMLQARIDTGVPASTGQAAIARLARAQRSLLTASNDMIRVHSDLSKIAQVHAGMDLHECPKAELVDDDIRSQSLSA